MCQVQGGGARKLDLTLHGVRFARRSLPLNPVLVGAWARKLLQFGAALGGRLARRWERSASPTSAHRLLHTRVSAVLEVFGSEPLVGIRLRSVYIASVCVTCFAVRPLFPSLCVWALFFLFSVSGLRRSFFMVVTWELAF